MILDDHTLITIRPDGAGRWIVELPGGEPLRTLLMKFGIAAYPFDRYFIHAAFPDDDGPRTFDLAEWNREGRGVRVGPWPGWRGIPELPAVHILIDGRPCRTDPVFFGDELRRGVVRLAVSLETGDPVLMVVTPADPRWIPLRAEFLPGSRVPVEPVHATVLPHLAGRHPRLFFSETDITVMRSRAAESHREHWQRIEALLANDDGEVPELTAQAKLPVGPERLFPEDRLLLTALAAIVDPTAERVARGREALFAFTALTARPDYAPLGIDTQCGEMLFVLCAGYDWLHPFLSHTERVDASARIFAVADRCAAFLPDDRRDIAQAHYLGCALGLLAFSLVFHEEHPASATRISHFHGALRRILSMLPEDGFYPHGLNLWIYEHGFLLRWLELFRSCCGEDLWNETGYWRNASRFRAAATAPGGSYGITFGDPQYRVGGDAWCHMLIAKRTGDMVAQALGDLLMEEPVDGVDYRAAPARRRVYEFLCDDPGMSMIATPSQAHFLDGGQIFLRSDDCLCTVRSGAPLGRQRRAAGECGGYGHSDPANGSFLVFDRGEFVVSGPGPSYRRDTAQHNVFSVDGSGQIGDSAVWFPDALPERFIPQAPRIRALGAQQAIFMDLARCYHPDLGVRDCTRTLFIEIGSRLLGVDRIALQRARPLQWNLHSWLPIEQKESADSELRYIFRGSVPRTLLAVSSPAASSHLGLTDFVPAYPHDGRRDHALSLGTDGDALTVVWALDLKEGLTTAIRLDERGCVWTSGDGSEFRYDYSSHGSHSAPAPSP